MKWPGRTPMSARRTRTATREAASAPTANPEDRFAPLQHAFDLYAVVREMAEVPARRGQR